MTREPAHMHLVDDQILQWDLQRSIALPVVVVENDPGTVLEGGIPVRCLSPHIPAADGASIGVQQHGSWVEAVEGRLPRLGTGKAAIHAEAVFDGLMIQIQHGHGEDIADAELLPNRLFGKCFEEHPAEGDLDQWLLGALLEDHQDAIVGIVREHREIDPTRHQRGAERIGVAGAYLVALVFVGGMDIDTLHVQPISQMLSSTLSQRTKNARNPVADMLLRMSLLTSANTTLASLDLASR